MQTKKSLRFVQSVQWAERMVLLVAVFCLPLFHWVGIGGDDPFVAAKTIFLAYAIALLAAMRALRLVLDRDVVPDKILAVLTILWAAVSAVSLYINPEPLHFFRESLLQWVILLWIYLLIGMPQPHRLLPSVLIVSSLSGTIVAVIALIQVVLPEWTARYLPYQGAVGDIRHAVFATLGNPEHLGGYLAAVLIITAGLAIQRRRLILRLILILCILPQVLALVRTGARGAWIGALVGLLVLSVVESVRKRTRGLFKAALAATFILALASGALIVFSTANPLNPYRADFLGRIKELRDVGSQSVRHRLALVSAASRMIVDRPLLGVGPGHFSHEYYMFLERQLESDPDAAIADYLSVLQGRNPGHAHSDLLEYWAETGTIGFLILLMLIAYGLAKLRRGAFAMTDSSADLTICLAVILVILVESLFGFPLHLPTRGALFWCLLILGARAADATQTDPTDHPVSSAESEEKAA